MLFAAENLCLRRELLGGKLDLHSDLLPHSYGVRRFDIGITLDALITHDGDFGDGDRFALGRGGVRSVGTREFSFDHLVLKVVGGFLSLLTGGRFAEVADGDRARRGCRGSRLGTRRGRRSNLRVSRGVGSSLARRRLALAIGAN